MPARSRPPLTTAARRKLVAELAMLGELKEQAVLDIYMHVSRAYDAGMTVREIADVYGVTPTTATRWKDAGERERARRRRGDPDRPGEPEPVG